MKSIKYLFKIMLPIVFIGFTACENDGDDPIVVAENPLEEYNLLTRVTSNSHAIEIYSEEQQFMVGYNTLFVRIKDEASGSYFDDVAISWNPVMHMTEMMHSCPKSTVAKTDDASVYQGYVVFQMPGNTDEYWELALNYTIDGQTYDAAERIEVVAPSDGNKRVNVFMGSDDVRYVLAMLPFEPEVAVNDFSAMLFKMENMMEFPVVANYKVVIDP